MLSTWNRPSRVGSQAGGELKGDLRVVSSGSRIHVPEMGRWLYDRDVAVGCPQGDLNTLTGLVAGVDQAHHELHGFSGIQSMVGKDLTGIVYFEIFKGEGGCFHFNLEHMDPCAIIHVGDKEGQIAVMAVGAGWSDGKEIPGLTPLRLPGRQVAEPVLPVGYCYIGIVTGYPAGNLIDR